MRQRGLALPCCWLGFKLLREGKAARLAGVNLFSSPLQLYDIIMY
jgi:hypothetical protein